MSIESVMPNVSAYSYFQSHRVCILLLDERCVQVQRIPGAKVQRIPGPSYLIISPEGSPSSLVFTAQGVLQGPASMHVSAPLPHSPILHPNLVTLLPPYPLGNSFQPPLPQWVPNSHMLKPLLYNGLVQSGLCIHSSRFTDSIITEPADTKATVLVIPEIPVFPRAFTCAASVAVLLLWLFPPAAAHLSDKASLTSTPPQPTLQGALLSYALCHICSCIIPPF